MSTWGVCYGLSKYITLCIVASQWHCVKTLVYSKNVVIYRLYGSVEHKKRREKEWQPQSPFALYKMHQNSIVTEAVSALKCCFCAPRKGNKSNEGKHPSWFPYEWAIALRSWLIQILFACLNGLFFSLIRFYPVRSYEPLSCVNAVFCWNPKTFTERLQKASRMFPIHIHNNNGRVSISTLDAH